MISRNQIQEQLGFTLKGVDIPRLGVKYEGKVRDCYVVGDRRVIITTDRLSAFDVVLTTIPFKGQLLSEMAAFWFDKTKHIVPNHILGHPHPNVFIAREVEVLPIEVVVRGYLAGSAWRDYEKGLAVSGVVLPAGMKKSEKFDRPIITPSTKAEKGTHDMPISSSAVVASRIVEKTLWEEVSTRALELFEFGTVEAAKRGLILVDTKYEFGVLRTRGGTELILADEIHTQDSSRYWIADSYQERVAAGEDPQMLDKEFVRTKLIALGYMGEGTPPVLSDDFRVDTAERYMEVYERLTGEQFKATVGAIEQDIIKVLSAL